MFACHFVQSISTSRKKHVPVMKSLRYSYHFLQRMDKEEWLQFVFYGIGSATSLHDAPRLRL